MKPHLPVRSALSLLPLFIVGAGAVSLFNPSLVAQADTTTLSAVADVSLMENNKGELNTGGDTQIAGGVLANGDRTRILLRFDLSGIPANAVIHSVTLTTTAVKQNFNAPGVVFAVHPMLVTWNEGRGTGSVGQAALAGETSWKWRSAPTELWSSPGGKPGTDFASAASSTSEVHAVGPVVFESTTLLVHDVQNWLAHPGLNFGWILKASSESASTTARRFATREADDGAPTLTLEYDVPTPELKIAPPVVKQGSLTLQWSATTPPYQVQRKSAILGPWLDFGSPQDSTQAVIPITGSQGYLRVIEVRPSAQ